MKIGLGNDHIVPNLKLEVKKYLESKGHEVINVGTDSEERTHYPYYAAKVISLLKNKQVDLGIVICGTGVGITLAANKFKGIRCMLCRTPEEARIAKSQYDMNILGLGGRVQGIGTIEAIIDAFLKTKFIASDENKQKVEKLNSLIEKDLNIENPEEYFESCLKNEEILV